MTKVRLAGSIESDSIVDGEGIRTVIWFQGCSHNCKGCHNPESHAFDAGEEVDVEDVKKVIRELEFQSGVTFSGGDPMFQPEALLELAKCTHECGMNVWCYSGFTYEQLLELSKNKPIYADILNEIDILVDGKFELDKKNFTVKFRGSSNQRIIDVKESLKSNKIVEVPKYIYEGDK